MGGRHRATGLELCRDRARFLFLLHIAYEKPKMLEALAALRPLATSLAITMEPFPPQLHEWAERFHLDGPKANWILEAAGRTLRLWCWVAGESGLDPEAVRKWWRTEARQFSLTAFDVPDPLWGDSPPFDPPPPIDLGLVRGWDPQTESPEQCKARLDGHVDEKWTEYRDAADEPTKRGLANKQHIRWTVLYQVCGQSCADIIDREQIESGQQQERDPSREKAIEEAVKRTARRLGLSLRPKSRVRKQRGVRRTPAERDPTRPRKR